LKSFEEGRKFVHLLNLKNSNDWKEYCKSGRKPKDIPYDPREVYKDKFNGMNDWLGSANVSAYDRKYIDFEGARQFVHSLKLGSSAEWQEYCKSGRTPKDIPYDPGKVYKNEWKSMGDWLGTGTIATQQMKYRPFEEAREFIHSLKLRSQAEWTKYRKSGRKPRDIPSNPNRTYKNEWKGFGDWLGTGTIAPFEMEFRPFEEARQYVHKLGIKNYIEWIDYCKSGNKPADIPADFQLLKRPSLLISLQQP
jgi:Phage-integrase repeat unit